MDRFIQREYIAHYRRLLAERDVANDPIRQKLLSLADEEARETKSYGQ